MYFLKHHYNQKQGRKYLYTQLNKASMSSSCGYPDLSDEIINVFSKNYFIESVYCAQSLNVLTATSAGKWYSTMCLQIITEANEKACLVMKIHNSLKLPTRRLFQIYNYFSGHYKSFWGIRAQVICFISQYPKNYTEEVL